MPAKIVKELIKEVEHLGLQVVRGGKGHWKIFREGIYLTSIPNSPSDFRAIRNGRQALRRHGVPIK